MSNKRIRMIIITLFLLCSGLVAVLIFSCIRDYTKFDEDNLILSHHELTFEKYEERHGRSGWYIVLHFYEYEKTFNIPTVTSKAINKENLRILAENDVLDVIFCEEFEGICGISCDGVEILGVSDYAKANQNSQIIRMICCICAYLCVLFLAWVFIRAIKPITDNDGLGKIRMESVVKGNVIRIYHSRHMCSLVINGQIFDKHHGVYGSNYSLKGTVGTMRAGVKPMRIEAKMGVCHMYLYCNGELIAKKFMAFG